MHLLHITCFVLLCSLVRSKNFSSVRCSYIEDVIRGKEDTDGVLDSPTNTNFCIRGEGESEFESPRLALDNSDIGVLKKNSIRNMPWLQSIFCLDCKIDFIEAGAFQNLTSLYELVLRKGVMTELRRGVFDKLSVLEALDISDNQVYTIDDQAFANMPALRIINLNGNNMEYWKREWFTNTSTIEDVKFIKNQLRSLPPLAFAEFKAVENIYFDDNQISVIHKDAFKGVTSLFVLGLANNRLTTLSENMFPDKIKIQALDISGNELNYIPSKVLRKLTTDKMFLEGNPWKCQCLNQIYFWLDLTGGLPNYNSKDPLCSGPDIPVCFSIISSTCLETLDRELTKHYNSHLQVIKRKENRKCSQGYYALYIADQD